MEKINLEKVVNILNMHNEELGVGEFKIAGPNRFNLVYGMETIAEFFIVENAMFISGSIGGFKLNTDVGAYDELYIVNEASKVIKVIKNFYLVNKLAYESFIDGIIKDIVGDDIKSSVSFENTGCITIDFVNKATIGTLSLALSSYISDFISNTKNLQVYIEEYCKLQFVNS